VYGANTHMPFSVHDNVDHPLSLYGATKKANELMRMPMRTCFACRRPACACSRSMARGAGRTWRCGCSPPQSWRGKPIKLFDKGRMRRDFTYIDDVVEAVVRMVERAPAPNPDWSGEAPTPAPVPALAPL